MEPEMPLDQTNRIQVVTLQPDYCTVHLHCQGYSVMTQLWWQQEYMI